MKVIIRVHMNKISWPWPGLRYQFTPARACRLAAGVVLPSTRFTPRSRCSRHRIQPAAFVACSSSRIKQPAGLLLLVVAVYTRECMWVVRYAPRYLFISCTHSTLLVGFSRFNTLKKLTSWIKSVKMNEKLNKPSENPQNWPKIITNQHCAKDNSDFIHIIDEHVLQCIERFYF